MTAGMSRSGARIRGDDYQHLFTWVQVAKAVQEGSNVSAIGIEDPDAGNADDVTIYRMNGEREYYQVKSSVDGRNTLAWEWLTKPNDSSVLQRFYKLWANEPDGKKPRISLVTNRLPTPADPLLSNRDGRDHTVVRALEAVDTKLGIVRKQLAEHLGINEAEVVRFFQDLRFVLGVADAFWMEMAESCMLAAGLRHDEDAVMQGVGIVRSWVTGGRRRIDAGELRRAVEPLKQPNGLPSATILVQEIDRDPVPDNATVTIDWVDSFPGSEPRVRRQPSDPALWNEQFRPEIKQKVRCLQAQGHMRVLVRGHMRLPAWFAVGVELGKTAGFQVSSLQDRVAWPSDGDPSCVTIKHAVENLNSGRDLAVGVALAADLSQDVLGYLDGRRNGAGKYVHICPSDGINNHTVSNAAEARGWAYGIRDLVRSLVREHRPDNIHLFLAVPHGVALLLGHLWDRMPPTQTYVDLGASGGYAPAYLIPG